MGIDPFAWCLQLARAAEHDGLTAATTAAYDYAAWLAGTDTERALVQYLLDSLAADYHA